MRDGSVALDPRLGRLEQFDDRSRDYQIRAVLNERGVKSQPVGALNSASSTRSARGRLWVPGPTLNQRREGQCVAEGCTDARNGSPDRQKPPITDFAARNEFYHACQHRDPWPGCARGGSCTISPDPRNAYGGTSVLAGGMEGRDRGYWREVRWLGAGSGRLEDDLIDTLRNVGGVLFGIPWLAGMYETTPDGLVEVAGAEVGGHCLHGWEWAPRQRMRRHWSGTRPGVWWHNSWGPQLPETSGGYGVRRRGIAGCGFILLDDLLGLLDNRRGEGMVPLL